MASRSSAGVRRTTWCSSRTHRRRGDPPAHVDLVFDQFFGGGAPPHRVQVAAAEVVAAGVIHGIGERAAVAKLPFVPDPINVVEDDADRPCRPAAAPGPPNELVQYILFVVSGPGSLMALGGPGGLVWPRTLASRRRHTRPRRRTTQARRLEGMDPFHQDRRGPRPAKACVRIRSPVPTLRSTGRSQVSAVS